MPQENLGNQLNRLISGALESLFEQAELAQLTYGAFDIAAQALELWEQDEIIVSFPVGYAADKQTMEGKRTYRKEQLLGRYQFLAFQQLAVNGIVHMVAIVEGLFSDVLRTVILRYPQKLGGKRTIPMQTVLQAQTIEEVHLRATDSLLHDLSYKAPSEFAEAIQPLLSVNLFECPAFHRYLEVKASRDIYIHNAGVANDVYVRKAGTHARVRSGAKLPSGIQYFLESYEACLQLTEWLEEQLHLQWHSSELEDRRASRQIELPLIPQATGGENSLAEPAVAGDAGPAVSADDGAEQPRTPEH